MRSARAGAAFVASLACEVAVCHAQEIAPFRITGVEGYTAMRYVTDELKTQSGGAAGGGVRTRQAQSSMREEVFAMTHSYVYHPNLVTLDVGGGPILQQGRFVNDAGTTSSQDTLYNFAARASFLRDKPYQGAVFFEHLNPTVSVAPGQVMTQENEQYGLNLALLAPVTPVPVRLDAVHSHFHGRGTDRFIDEQIDRVSLRASRSFGALGSTQVQYQAIQQESQSGSPNLPIQRSNSTGQGINIDSRFQFGSNREYDLTNLISRNQQTYTLESGALPGRTDTRVLFDVRGRHSEKLQSFALYNYSSSVQGDLSSTLHAASGGLTYWPTPELATAVSVRDEDNITRQSTNRTQGVDGSVRYQQPLPVGEAQLNYGVRYDRREQQAATTTTNVIGERIVLVGLSFSALSRQHVVPGSITVSNATRTQTYMEGSDYLVTVVGTETRLQRVIGGNIVDGQDLLVDYAFDIGGSFSYRQRDQTASMNWSYRGFFNAYFRYFQSEPQLTSGEPTFALNHITSQLYGARADVPLKLRVETMLGGNIEHENRQETISPYRRQYEEAYAAVEDPFFSSGNFRLGLRRSRVEYTNSAQGVNLRGYDVRFWSRRFFGIDLIAEASHETDNGGTVPRSRAVFSVKTLWSYRKLKVTFDLGRTRETQGFSERSRSGAHLLVRRDF